MEDRTREYKYIYLINKIEKGPSFGLAPIGWRYMTESELCLEFENRCRNWLETWVRPLVEDLVPELKNKQC